MMFEVNTMMDFYKEIHEYLGTDSDKIRLSDINKFRKDPDKFRVPQEDNWIYYNMCIIKYIPLITLNEDNEIDESDFTATIHNLDVELSNILVPILMFAKQVNNSIYYGTRLLYKKESKLFVVYIHNGNEAILNLCAHEIYIKINKSFKELNFDKITVSWREISDSIKLMKHSDNTIEYRNVVIKESDGRFKLITSTDCIISPAIYFNVMTLIDSYVIKVIDRRFSFYQDDISDMDTVGNYITFKSHKYVIPNYTILNLYCHFILNLNDGHRLYQIVSQNKIGAFTIIPPIKFNEIIKSRMIYFK